MAAEDFQQQHPNDRDSGDRQSNNEVANNQEKNTLKLKKEPVMLRVWKALGLNPSMIMMMFKGALPPTISLAIYQSTAVAEVYSTIGYLIAIMSVISFAILPRSKFIQTMLLNIIGVCIGAAVALLAIYCSVQARIHTSPVVKPTANGPSPGAALSGYNSSASAVSAIWLFFNIYVVNTLRAARPQLQFPVILYSIFANVALTYAPGFPTMTAGISFIKRLLETFLTGFAIASGVSLFIFPVTVRMSFFKQSAGLITAIEGTLRAHMSYLHSLEDRDLFRPSNSSNGDSVKEKHTDFPEIQRSETGVSTETQKIKAAVAGLGELYGKMHADITFAKRESAWGKLDADDIDELNKLFQGIILPLTGMSSLVDIFQRIATKYQSVESKETSSIGKKRSDRAKIQWNEIMTTLHDPFNSIIEVMLDGLQHTLHTLELAKPPKKQKGSKSEKATDAQYKDIEANIDASRPGDIDYALQLTRKVDAFFDDRKSTLSVFSQHKGIKLKPRSFDGLTQPASTVQREDHQGLHDEETANQDKRQLYLVLYMYFLLGSTGRAVSALVDFADRKVKDGTMKKRRVILPGMRRLKKWFFAVLKPEDAGTEHTPDALEGGSSGLFIGESFQKAKDPEHLPPTNIWQRFGNSVRNSFSIIGSPESSFGFRVACATLTIGIVAYLERTHVFFLEQRLVWAMIMVAIGMTVTAGSGLFGFFGRISGTFVAMCTSLVIWYIVDGHPAGVIVFIFVFTFLETYFFIKYPRFIQLALITMITQVLITGYELEVRKVGEKVATSNGQIYYQTYLLAPYRLATVSGGMFVAFIWTFFPYPLTDRSQLRKDLGESLYLLANYYSIMHTTVSLRVRGREGDMKSKQSPGRRIEKVRREVYVKELALLSGLRKHSDFTAWEPSLGGKFPRKQYDTIIQEVENILHYLALMSFASSLFSHDPDGSPDEGTWVKDFARLVGSIEITTQGITSTLALLSSAVTTGNPLPPYLKAPQSYRLSARLEELDADILSFDHILEPGYSAFAVMQITSSLVSEEMGKLIQNVKALVGEVDFSFHVISTAASSDDSLSKDDQKGKKD